MLNKNSNFFIFCAFTEYSCIFKYSSLPVHLVCKSPNYNKSSDSYRITLYILDLTYGIGTRCIAI